MKPPRVDGVLFAIVFAVTATTASGQDLFELEVFDFETMPPGQYEIGLHTNLLSSNGVAPDSTASNHRPAHVSIEIARGWTQRFETALFVQTAPFGPSGSKRFAGGHLRGQFRIGDVPGVPLRLAVSAEYIFNRAAFDQELQALELRTIVEYTRGRLSLIANPSLELVTRGHDGNLAPVFDVSARAAWYLGEGVTITTDYFSTAATTRHLQPARSPHDLVFGGFDVDVGLGWELGFSAGHCVTSDEPWVMKSVIGYRF
jgi:hypothetical protein